VVINDAGADVDFRVEGVGRANALFVQGSDGFVGVGNAAPSTALDVTGTVTSDGADLDGAVTINASKADVDTVISGDTDTNLIYVDASTDRVGIGIASPQTKLHITGGFTQDGGNASFERRLVVNSGQIAAGDFIAKGDTDGNLFFVDAGNETVQVGAATSPNSKKFYVSGDIDIAASGAYHVNGTAGITQSVVILDGDGATTHTLTFTKGILTAYSAA